LRNAIDRYCREPKHFNKSACATWSFSNSSRVRLSKLCASANVSSDTFFRRRNGLGDRSGQRKPQPIQDRLLAEFHHIVRHVFVESVFTMNCATSRVTPPAALDSRAAGLSAVGLCAEALKKKDIA